jgi:hypothetical protein
MKKTIAAIALLASSNAYALRPPPETDLKKACVKVHKMQDRSGIAGCDETSNNERANLRLRDNGCAKGQVAISTYGELDIEACLPPGIAQL